MKRFLFFFFLFFCVLTQKKEIFAFDLTEVYDMGEYDDSYKTGVIEDSDDDIVLFADYTAGGVIPSPYIDYLQNAALSRSIFKHYVAFSSYETIGGHSVLYYAVAIGDLTYSNSFSGDVTIYKYYPSSSYSGTFYKTYTDSNFYLASANLIFTDLPDTPFTDFLSPFYADYFLFFLLVGIVLFCIFTSFFRSRYLR